MDSDLLELVCGMPVAELKLTSACVHGYRQCEVMEESYPVLVPSESSAASGMLIEGLTPGALQRILFFEGEEYFLHPIDAVTDHNHERSAFYFRDAGVYTVRDSMWDFERWLQLHKVSFLNASREYMKLFGTMTAAEADAHWIELTQDDQDDTEMPAVAV